MTNQRYSISGLKIIDAEADPVSEIYIREILDMPSAEFRKSWLNERQRMDIIQALGLEALTKVLDECYRQGGKNYDAAQEAEFTVLMLNKILERQAPPPAAAEVSLEAQPVVKFMQQYFEEQTALELAAEERSAAFRERCFTADYLAELGRDWEEKRRFTERYPAVVVEVEVSGNEASAITSEPNWDSSETRIYHLLRANGSWRIDKKGHKCFQCDGTGHDFKHGCLCLSCDGTGWSYYGASAR